MNYSVPLTPLKLLIFLSLYDNACTCRFNTDEYPKSYEKLRKSSWKDYEQNFNTTMVKLLHLLEKTSNGSRIMKQLTSGQSLPTSGASQSFCPQISNDGTVKSELKKWPEVFLNHSISLFALNYRTPKYAKLIFISKPFRVPPLLNFD